MSTEPASGGLVCSLPPAEPDWPALAARCLARADGTLSEHQRAILRTIRDCRRIRPTEPVRAWLRSLVETPVSAEALGKARDLRRRLAAVEAQLKPAMRQVLRPLHQRLARHPIQRPEKLISAVRAWRNLLPLGRLRCWTSIGDRRNPRFDELRAIPIAYRDCDDAEGTEPGLGVVMHTAFIERGVVVIDQRGPFVAISLHALARRIERAPLGREGEGFIAMEIGELAVQFPKMAPTSGNFSFQGWRGHMAEYASGQPLASVRTFIGEPALAARNAALAA